MTASKMTEKRLAALEEAVRVASEQWTLAAGLAEQGGSPGYAVEFRERAVQAESALEVVKGRFTR